MFLRSREQDRRKDARTIKEQLAKNLTCKAPDCSNPISQFTGPGNKHLCRDHQLEMAEYGGLGKLDRIWTFSREWSCSWCGYSPKDDPWFDNPPIPFDNETHKHLTMRSMLVADHKERNVDGGGHGKDNIQTLCQNCNAKKTALYKDFQRREIVCT